MPLHQMVRRHANYNETAADLTILPTARRAFECSKPNGLTGGNRQSSVTITRQAQYMPCWSTCWSRSRFITRPRIATTRP